MIIVRDKPKLREFARGIIPIEWKDFIKLIYSRNGTSMAITINLSQMSSVINMLDTVKLKINGSNLNLHCGNSVITIKQADVTSITTNDPTVTPNTLGFGINLKNGTFIAIGA